MYAPENGKYIEILGHKIELDGVNSFETFREYLLSMDELEREKVRLNSKIRQLEEDRKEFQEYLETKLEEAKLCRDHIKGDYFPNIQEMIYEEVLKRYTK